MKNDCGVIYIATGGKYVELAARSAQSLKECCPDLPAHIFTDCDISAYDCFEGSTEITDPHIRSKVDYIFQTPYQRTLYLDADTRVCEDITHMFELLDKFDLAMAHCLGRREENLQRYLGSLPPSFPPFNGGVILFKQTDPVIRMLKSWKKAYHAEGLEMDQLTLRQLVWLSDLKVAILPPEYNIKREFMLETFERSKITPKILHIESKVEMGIEHKHFSMPVRKKLRKQVRKVLKRFPRAEHFIFGTCPDFIERKLSRKDE